jgi:hypothetical protein
VQPLPGVHAVERLVEQQDRRLVDERRGDLRPLPHALRIAADRPVGGRLEVDRANRHVGGALGIGQLVQARRHLDELAAGEEGLDRLALRDEPDRPIDRGVPPGGQAADEDASVRRLQQAREHVQDRRLAGSVRAEEAGDSGAQRERDLVDGDDRPIEARDVVEDDRRRRGPGRGVRGRQRSERRDGHTLIVWKRRMQIANEPTIPTITAAK